MTLECKMPLPQAPQLPKGPQTMLLEKCPTIAAGQVSQGGVSGGPHLAGILPDSGPTPCNSPGRNCKYSELAGFTGARTHTAKLTFNEKGKEEEKGLIVDCRYAKSTECRASFEDRGLGNCRFLSPT
eukprot:1142098-Pelagomonas_calceolata.AAC.1